MRSEERLETGVAEVAIVGEGFAQAEAAHHGKGKLIDQAGAARRVGGVGGPGSAPQFFVEVQQAAGTFKPLPEPDDFHAVGASRGRVAALGEDVWCREKERGFALQKLPRRGS